MEKPSLFGPATLVLADGTKLDLIINRLSFTREALPTPQVDGKFAKYKQGKLSLSLEADVTTEEETKVKKK